MKASAITTFAENSIQTLSKAKRQQIKNKWDTEEKKK